MHGKKNNNFVIVCRSFPPPFFYFSPRKNKEGIHIEFDFFFFFFPFSTFLKFYGWIWGNFFNAFRLEVQLRENEITMEKSVCIIFFVSCFVPLLSCSLTPACLFSVDIFISQLFQRDSSFIFISYYILSNVSSPCSMRLGQKWSEVANIDEGKEVFAVANWISIWFE